MDRNLAYVSMNRHREGATLYAARDEFADIEALSARLSRSQAKETTLDYAHRRGIEFPSEIVMPIPEVDRSSRPPRIVKEWRGLKTQHEHLSGWQHVQARKRIELRMKEVAGELKRDTQLESLMRTRVKELGIDVNSRLGRILQAPSATLAIDLIIRDRDRGLSR